MPMTEKRWARIKKQLELWHIMDEDHLDPAAAGDVIREMRNTITEIMTAAEEPDEPERKRSWFARLFGR